MKQDISTHSIIPRETIFGKPLNLEPKISPDGSRIIYLSSVDNIMNFRIKSLDLDDDRPITFWKNDIKGYYFWSSDKYVIWLQEMSETTNRFLYRLHVETGEIKELIAEKKLGLTLVSYNPVDFPDEIILAINKNHPSLLDLYHMDVFSGTLTLIEKNPGNVRFWVMDNELKLRGMVLHENGDTHEIMVKEKDNYWKKIFRWNIDEEQLTQPIGFSKDNDYLYLIDGKHHNTSEIVKVEIKTGNIEILAYHNEYDIYTICIYDDTIIYDLPVMFSPSTCDLQAVSIYKFRREWIVLDETIKEDFEAIRKLNKGDFLIVNRDREDKIWIINFENDDCPPLYYAYNRNLKKGTFLFYSRPDLSSMKLASTDEITFTAGDGLTIHGYITCPHGKEKNNLPVVLSVHKGPWFRDTWGFKPLTQWFASRGYACLQINYRGSLGYGKDFRNAGNKEWGGKMQDDLIDGVKWAINKGIANPRKIAIYGSGYGGYAALVGATFTPDVFACAMAVGCPGNLVSFLEAIFDALPPYARASGNTFIKRIGDPFSEKDLLISRSPFYKLENIKIPILIAHGLKNQRIKSEETYEVVRYLRSKGIETEYVVFHDEGYYITKKKNLMKLYGLSEKFLSKSLGGIYEEIELYMSNIYISTSGRTVVNDKYFINKILAEGDRMAFENLLKYYEKPLLKYFFDLTGEPGISMELLHETFFRIWMYLDSYDHNMPFHSWMFKIASNVVKKYRINEVAMNEEIKFDDLGLEPHSSSGNIDERLFIDSAIDSLKEPYRTSFLLRFVDDLDYEDIASIMKINVGQVKNYLHRAKKSMFRYFMQHGQYIEKIF